MLDFLSQEIESLKSAGLYRQLKRIEKINGPRITVDGKDYLLFCSNNYLGLANHPKIIQKTIKIIKEFGFGAGASRLISGNTIIHEELERRIAQFKEREAAVVFPTGYMANIGAITSLVDENDTVIIDRLNHASIIDACRLSKAKIQVYSHKDMQALEKILIKSDKYQKRLIITDSVFSMDGDIAPLTQIVELAKKYDAITMIDEAHATGCIGKQGRGVENFYKSLGMQEDVDIVMGTLSKALGSLGGFVAGSHKLIDYLINKARSFIYTTALPPSACAASIAALDILESDQSPLSTLWLNTEYLREKLNKLRLNTKGSKTQIIPILIGDAQKTMEISQELFKRGIFISGIRPPTVPKDESRLRITVSASHSKEDLECLASSLQALTQR
jgi:8-amino-7-oxononanoate synthase